MNKCIIIGAGEFDSRLWEKEAADYVIAADGGYEHLAAMGIRPDVLIGDMDSIQEKELEKQTEEKFRTIRLPKEKDDTDMLAAIKLGMSKGYYDFALYGGLGGRMDHSLANLQCLLYLKNRGCKGRLYGSNYQLELLADESVEYPAEYKGMISVFAFGGDAVGVTEEGLKYDLKDAVLKQEFPIGVSNEFTGRQSRIEVKNGKLLVYMERI